MPSGIQTAGIDLDTLLMPIGANTPIANVAYQVSGTDIANRYAPASAGSPYGFTGINTSASGRSSNPDIGTLFAAASSSPTVITLTAGTFSPSGSITFYGFIQGSFGIISPTTIKGYTIFELYSAIQTSPSQYDDYFRIFSSVDPGSTLFNTMTVGAVVRNFSSASYSYGTNTASWIWSGTPDTSGLFQHTGTFSVSII